MWAANGHNTNYDYCFYDFYDYFDFNDYYDYDYYYLYSYYYYYDDYDDTNTTTTTTMRPCHQADAIPLYNAADSVSQSDLSNLKAFASLAVDYFAMAFPVPQWRLSTGLRWRSMMCYRVLPTPIIS